MISTRPEQRRVIRGIRATGALLDEGIHGAFRRFWPLAVPFVCIEFASTFDYLVFGSGSHLSDVGDAFLINRVFVVAFRSLAKSDGRRIVVRALWDSPRALWVVPLETLNAIPLSIVFMFVDLPDHVYYDYGFQLVRGPAGVVEAAVLIVIALAFLPMMLVTPNATMDIVLDDTSPIAAMRAWLRSAYGWKNVRFNIFACAALLVMMSGGYIGFEWAAYDLNDWQYAFVTCVPAAAMDLIGLFFALSWRKKVLASRGGALNV